MTADVAVGSLSNPSDYPGLAHFLEHVSIGGHSHLQLQRLSPVSTASHHCL